MDVAEEQTKDRLGRLRCFLSYSRLDRNRLAEVKVAIRGVFQAPIEFVIDTEFVESGGAWEAALASELHDSDIFALVWSRRASLSAWVLNEVLEALAKNPSKRRMIVVTLDLTPVPDRLSHIQTLELGRPPSTFLTRILPLVCLGGIIGSAYRVPSWVWGALLVAPVLAVLYAWVQGRWRPITLWRTRYPAREALVDRDAKDEPRL